ncbi:MAG: xanthine dehydrogenase family protein molybdopterin-binding subunit [Vulcanimicrobiota bacterium]
MLKFLPQTSRRQFLQVLGLGAAGLVVGCATSDGPAPASQSPTPGASATPAAQLEKMNHFVKIGADDTVTVVVKHSEFGQGSSTGLTAIVAEELDADWGQMAWEFAPADNKLYANSLMGIQGTGGSSSIANSWQQLREAGAGARALLVAAAAQQWGVPATEIEVVKGRISHPKSGKSSGFGALAAAAAGQKLPEKLTLKDPKKFTIIGQPLARLDGAEKSNGKAQFAIDQSLPGMRVALMLRPPKFGGKLKKLDDSQARALPGVFEVVSVPRGVAVIARDFWTALKARQKLKAEWDFSQAEKRGTPELLRDYKKQLQKPGALARNDGKAEAALASAAQSLELEYEFPYLAHAPMEPLGCLVDFKDGEVDLYYGAQLQTVDQATAAAIFDVSTEKVRIHSVFGGGSFGRRATPDSDFVAEACTVHKAAREKTPIKLMWDRTDDLHGGRYRPMSLHRVRGGLDHQGKPLAFFHRLVVQSFLADTPFAMMIKDGVDATSVEGSANSDYQIPNFRVEAHMAEGGVPTLWWRSVGHTYNAFVMETFVDALAHQAKQDPVQFRLGMLPKDSRRRGVLELAVAKAGPPPKGGANGVAVHESFGSFVAQVVQLASKGGRTEIVRVVCAVDCGIVVNPDQVRSQMESGINYALSAATGEAITLKDGQVEQSNFDSYRVLCINQAPPIEVHIVESHSPPTGTGEPGVPPLAPALANALFALNGKRITRLPFTV